MLLNEKEIIHLAQQIKKCDAIVVGAGAGLSTAAGFTYEGERFQKYFADFIERYHFQDMYTAGFYPFETSEIYWAYWSRHIFYNRYVAAPKDTYEKLLNCLKDKDYFVITTNVDHQFQKAGFPKSRLFYTQGDYGLWQCSQPCHQTTYDNEALVKAMMSQQENMKIPTALVPRCPRCGALMTMNLRCDQTFVQDQGWYHAQARYEAFLRQHRHDVVLYWELGVGYNTPGIIKYPFWQYTLQNPQAIYACVNVQQAICPTIIQKQAILINADIDATLTALLLEKEKNDDPE